MAPMRYRWPLETAFTQRVLTVEQEVCSHCQRGLNICDHRFHRFFTLSGPVEMVCKLARCPERACVGHAHTLSPLAEAQLTLPWWLIGWDVFCWLGHRRFARHWSIPQLQAELRDSYRIPLSDDAISYYLRRYQTMVAARHQDAVLLAAVYRNVDELFLTIDGLQPEKGHETLYVVRELRSKRVWFVKAIAAEFPKTPHRYCQNHFLRDVAKPMLEADSQAKVTMRSKVRGLRAIERDVLAQQTAVEVAPPAAAAEDVPAAPVPAATTAEGDVVLAYCTAVRGILNDSQGGPLTPPGLRMAEALGEVRESLQRNLAAKKGGPRKST